MYFDQFSLWVKMPIVCLSTLESMFGQMASKFCEMLQVEVRRSCLFNFAPTYDMCDVTFTLLTTCGAH